MQAQETNNWIARCLKQLALGLGLLAVLTLPARAAEIRDEAGLFGEAARQRAEAALERIERETGVPVLIQTLESLNGQPIERLAQSVGTRWGRPGVLVLIARRDQKVHVSSFRGFIGRDRERQITETLVSAFRGRDFDGGLEQAIARIEQAARAVQRPAGRTDAEARPAGPAEPAPAPNPSSSSGASILLVLGLVILAIFILGRLFNRRPAYGPAPGPWGAASTGPAPGGGFFSGLLGGLGGALAGHWLYDQMTGRHDGPTHTSPGVDPAAGQLPPSESNWFGGGSGDWSGGATGDWSGDAGDWSGGTGGDWSGGDVGGGDWS
ncbi:MAG: hypothetical protein KatS3mg108_0606 [Isosphaeraceae bacterium]|jgi:uncharacterized protein|nr:MAG: hypothetical protein KatS3mg108_0606 [Isosphaeraceae bacterium]